MACKVIHVAVNGVTGRMGYRQHLVRSLLAIREQGGVRRAGRSATRRRRPGGCTRLYTGDDYHYAELIRGDAEGHSDALLGTFAAITVPAAAALRALDRGDPAGYDAAMAPTVPLSRAIFEPPTYHYKVGIAFLAWLNGLQPHFAMLGGRDRPRRREDRQLPGRRLGAAAAAGHAAGPRPSRRRRADRTGSLVIGRS
jgi:Protein of unknown function (DUF993)